MKIKVQESKSKITKVKGFRTTFTKEFHTIIRVSIDESFNGILNAKFEAPINELSMEGFQFCLN